MHRTKSLTSRSTLAKLLYNMHYSCCNVLKRQFLDSAISQLASTSVQGRFCTYRSKILAPPACKIAQTRLQRFSNYDSIVPQVTNNNQPYCPQASAPSIEFEHENVRFFYKGKMVHIKKIK